MASSNSSVVPASNSLCPKPASPPKWKTAVLTTTGLYPLVLWLFPLLSGLMAGWLPWLRHLLTVLLAVPLMTWGVMPLLSCVLHHWLYASSLEDELSQNIEAAKQR